jgi:hypothetical protein
MAPVRPYYLIANFDPRLATLVARPLYFQAMVKTQITQ